MATLSLPLVLLLCLFAATVSGRPCKTLFYFSSTTTTTYLPYNSLPLNNNPNSPNSILRIQNPRYLTFIFTTTTTTTRRPFVNFNSDPQPSSLSSIMTSSDSSPLKLHSNSNSNSSIRDRTKDIMSVVGALLFGVGCGALTAATMYFVWAVCSSRGFEYEDVSSEDDDESDDDVTAIKKKFGYVAIPANPNPKVVDVDEDCDFKKPAAPLDKEEV